VTERSLSRGEANADRWDDRAARLNVARFEATLMACRVAHRPSAAATRSWGQPGKQFNRKSCQESSTCLLARTSAAILREPIVNGRAVASRGLHGDLCARPGASSRAALEASIARVSLSGEFVGHDPQPKLKCVAVASQVL